MGRIFKPGMKNRAIISENNQAIAHLENALKSAKHIGDIEEIEFLENIINRLRKDYKTMEEQWILVWNQKQPDGALIMETKKGIWSDLFEIKQELDQDPHAIFILWLPIRTIEEIYNRANDIIPLGNLNEN